MTDTLLQKIEEKVMILVTELEELRKEMHRVRQENSSLKAEKTNHAQKLQGLISLLEAVDVSVEPMHTHEHTYAQNRMEEVAAAM
jgi:regulator of replication initiation timing